ncbi:hypothetical protein D3C86_2125790 [compost metagenome]
MHGFNGSRELLNKFKISVNHANVCRCQYGLHLIEVAAQSSQLYRVAICIGQGGCMNSWHVIISADFALDILTRLLPLVFH